jgi:hypothetical protein
VLTAIVDRDAAAEVKILARQALSTTVVNSKALWHHALFDDQGGDDAKNGGPEDG